MPTDNADEIRRKVLAGRRRAKLQDTTARISQNKFTKAECALLLGCPLLSLCVLFGEPTVDPVVVAAIVGLNLFFFVFLETFSAFEKVTLVLLNVAILASGDRIRNLRHIAETVTLHDCLCAAALNAAIALACWFTAPKTFRDSNRSQFWDAVFALCCVCDLALALYAGKIAAHDIVRVLTQMKRLLPV